MNRRQHGSAHIVIIVIAVFVLLGALAFVFWRQFDAKDTSSVQATHESEVIENETAERNPDVEIALVGTITGTVRYPIEWRDMADRNRGAVFPEDLKVCAVDSNTQEEVVCETGFSSEKETYRLDVTPGDYLITAKTGDTVAYYDLYVGNSAQPIDACSEEASKPIVLTVEAGKTLENIDAADFWVGHLGC